MKPSSTAIALVVVLACLAVAGLASQPSQAPAVLELDELGGAWSPVHFPHEAHVSMVDGCRSCHHESFGKPVSCGNCHSEYVERTDFTHEKHDGLADCLTCHQVASMAEMRCSACHKAHPQPRRLQVIGLKGAFHQQCMGCHRDAGLDVSCTACHQRR